MTKKAIIVISLVKEASKKENLELEKEISEEFAKWPVIIPWMKDIEKITIVEES